MFEQEVQVKCGSQGCVLGIGKFLQEASRG